jgi:hypothetical protein
VARAIIKEESSSYYPPRSRWYTRLIFGVFRPVRRHTDLEGLRLPSGLSVPAFVLSLILPGYAFIALGRELIGRVLVAAYGLAALVFVAALGFFAGSLAYGLMISIHVTSIIFLEGGWLRESRLSSRFALALGTLVSVWGLIYSPLTSLVERRWLLPIRLGERVLIIHRGAALESLRRGDWVAYEFSGNDLGGHGAAVYLTSGLGVDPVLALPGDRVQFTHQAVLVNDEAFPRAPHMPTDGDLVVPGKVWFIWPTLAINMRGGVPEGNISALMQSTALVGQNQILGRPFKHWFGRRQWP